MNTALSRSAALQAPGRFEVTLRHPPQPQPGEVRVRLTGCGVCASNLPVWQGREWFDYPLTPGAPGHEGWGEIDAIGDGVDGLRVGDRVAMLSYHAYAEHDTARAEAVVRLPEQLADRHFPGEPLACAMNIARRSDIRSGDTVAVVGIGFLGGLLIQIARQAGARVIAVSRRPFSLEMARAMGADEVVPASDGQAAVERVRQLTDGRGCERVIEATGMQQALDLAGQLVTVRGRLVIAGFHQDGPRRVDLQLWNWLGLDVVNAHERDPAEYLRGMREALDAMREGWLDPAPLFTHHFGLDDLGRGFRLLDERPEGFVKGLLLL